MKKTILSAALLALGFVASTSVASAAVACATLLVTPPNTGSANVNSGGSGASTATSIDCTAGGLEFNNFQYQAAGGTGTAEIDLVSVTVNGAWVNLNFNPNEGGAGNLTDLHFTFAVNGVVFGAQLGDGGQQSSIQEVNCAGAGGTGLAGCSGATLFTITAPDLASGQCVGTTATTPSPQDPSDGNAATIGTCNYALAGQNGVSVWKDINLASTSGHDSSFSEGFLGATPEPMTISLMGAGLLGLGLIRRRAKK